MTNPIGWIVVYAVCLFVICYCQSSRGYGLKDVCKYLCNIEYPESAECTIDGEALPIHIHTSIWFVVGCGVKQIRYVRSLAIVESKISSKPVIINNTQVVFFIFSHITNTYLKLLLTTYVTPHLAP